ncbi:precorrin-2 C(20)-methyltransferase [Sediminispirochaeta smaragdinae]|uniref:Precorrin-2 C20-methyltransferase n=1 Tax=Sediminispirochaeta smaragdinae (strain DSM 11293 / JCM 15392 / SEBR 4228) TaxID=573413 RepID=E1R8K6_SEDSS|nr:precorrin-2 C(20)-methyltransferase [Sediminispirochaeta smaragdinae]ADK79350.1 precorrin-2 C20-methyltransferase [Sediminispirochaeta smaragdinae DSM 11293]
MADKKSPHTRATAKLIGIGVGPGDPGLLPLASAQAIKEADIVFTPVSRFSKASLAASIAAGTGIDESKIQKITFPMAKDTETLQKAWTQAAAPVIKALDNGLRAVFLTLGDPSVYSTWIYLRREVEAQRPSASIAVIPGIMAANAAAARLGLPLVEGKERLVLLPLPEKVGELDAYLPLADRIVVYKIGSRLEELALWVRERGLDEQAHLVVGVGLDREAAGRLIDLAEKEQGYLSVALIRGRRE